MRTTQHPPARLGVFCPQQNLDRSHCWCLVITSPTFSHHLNSQHQLDCLKSCLLLSPAPQQAEELTSLHCVYLLNNLDSDHAVVWALNNKHSSQLLGMA